MKNKILKNSKIIFGIVIGLLLSSGIVYAATQIASENVTYSNSKTSATTVKRALDELMDRADPVYPIELYKVAKVGDYVDYDAGEWNETVANPTTHGNFGGYTSGQNKANNSNWCYRELNLSVLKGWRILNISKTTVTLVHAGIPECYYHGTNSIDSVTKLNTRATSQYLNSLYAESAHMMDYDEALAIAGSMSNTENNLIYIGKKSTTSNNAPYWLVTAASTTNLWTLGIYGNIHGSNNNLSIGIRPVVILKSGIKTNGRGTDAVGQDAWTLIAP